MAIAYHDDDGVALALQKVDRRDHGFLSAAAPAVPAADPTAMTRPSTRAVTRATCVRNSPTVGSWMRRDRAVTMAAPAGAHWDRKRARKRTRPRQPSCHGRQK